MLDDLIKERQKKLDAIREAGIDPYPSRVARSFEIAQALADFDELEKSGRVISLAGRVMALRDQGKIVFADIADESGKIQIVLNEGTMTSDDKKDGSAGGSFKLWQSSLDIGDFVSATGPLFKTKKGEMSVDVREVQMASKSLLPLPDQHDGIENDDIRLRERYVELVDRPDGSRDVSKKVGVLGGDPRVSGARTKVYRSRNECARADGGRCGSGAVQDAPQRARHGFLSSHRARIAIEKT